MANSSISRSPSPGTPISSSSSDSAEPVIIQSLENSWGHSPKSSHQPSLWDVEQSIYKTEDTVEMLGIDDLLEKHAFEDPAAAMVEPSVVVPTHLLREEPRIIPDFLPSNLLVPSSNGPVSLSKPANPHHRRQELPVPNRKVVRPPKESCYNLPIFFPSMPEGVTKSRVETQIRLTVDLADTSSSSDPNQYDRVGSWKWLKLPDGTTTKKRPRKQVKPEPDLDDILYLTINITCASPPHNPVLSCSSCQNREAKRAAKKLATRVQTSEGDSDNGAKRASRYKTHEDTTSIIQFNCCDSVDFSAGSVVLPVRLTCYCRHHREKTGFIIHFTMMDHNGRIVGTGSTKPIMITDDHKTTLNNRQQNEQSSSLLFNTEFVWSTAETIDVNTLENTAPSKRKSSNAKSRNKPYDAAQAKRIISRETSVSSSPTSSYLPLTRSPTPPASAVPSLLYSSQDSASSSDALTINPLMTPISDSELSSSLQVVPSHPHAMPFIFLDPLQTSHSASALPTIHRLIPNAGPTHGGIEVTVLGANFHPSIPLTCVFGDVQSSSIQRWSDNTLVCILPPRATPGAVPVWFDGFPKTEGSVPTIFTYSDESDRALMELALQVVGLKMTGKIEDAKNIAMRIVGGDNQQEPQHRINTDDMMQMSTLRPLLLLRGSESEDFETNIVKLLSTVHLPVPAPDAIPMSEAASHQTCSGQTLLHLAALLDFSSLVRFLVQQEVDLDVRDRNGFTALHFAVFSQSKECVRILLGAGADREVVNNVGKTAEELAAEGFFEDIELEIGSDSDLEDEEAHWGDGEEDAGVIVRRSSNANSRTVSRKSSRRRLTVSRPPTPPPPVPSSEKKLPIDSVDEKQRAWFMEMIQRTLAQLPAAPQIPMPDLRNLPQLPGMPAWDALPQLPVVFPIFVPMMPGWPSFLGGHPAPTDQPQDKDSAGVGMAAIRLAQEQWRNAWEKLLALPQPQQTEPPPMYSPRADTEEGQSPNAPETPPAGPSIATEGPAVPADSRHIVRRAGYGDTPAVSAQEVDSFTYQPRPPQKKKQDRMLILFWIPILFLSFIWALHTGVNFAIQTIRSSLPVKAVLGA